MEAAWCRGMAKRSINCMIGLWATDEHFLYSCRTSRRTEDAIGVHAKRHVILNNNDTLFDFIYQTRLLSNCSFRPAHDQIVQTEHTLVAQLVHCVRALSVPVHCVKQVKTDCLLLQGHSTAQDAKLRALSKLQYHEMHALSEKFRPRGQQVLDSPLVAMNPRAPEDTASVYR